MFQIIKTEIIKNIIRDIWNFIARWDILMVTVTTALTYLAHITETIEYYAPFSYGFIIFITISIYYLCKDSRKNKRNIEMLIERLNRKNEVQHTETFIKFEFNNGFVPIESNNAQWTAIVNSPNSFTVIIALTISNEFSHIIMNPIIPWKLKHSTSRLWLIDISNIQPGAYRIEFK